MNSAATALAGAAAILFAVLALFQRTLYGSALFLLGVLLQVAAIFYLMGAPLLAFIQVLIYAGGVMVLIVVATMADPSPIPDLWARLGLHRGALPLAFLMLALEAAVFLRGGAPGSGAGAAAQVERAMAGTLFGAQAPLTELVGVLALVAALAAVPEEK